MEIIKGSFLDCQLSSAVVQGHENVLLGAVRLPVKAESVRAARRFVRFRLSVEALPDELIDAAELIVSELATNVVSYHDWDLEPVMLLGLSRMRELLQLEVHDTDPALPLPRQPSEERSENGRGLLVVDACSDSWGVGRTAEGKFVWAALTAWPDETHGHEA